MRIFGRFLFRVAFFLLAFVLAACASYPQPISSPATPAVPITGESGSPGPVVSTPVSAGTGAPDVLPTQGDIATPSGTPSGDVIVTLENNGQTIHLPVGGSFLLNLGEPYNWDVTVSDQSILARKVNILVIRGAQGVYEALKPGQVTLSAAGDPACRALQPPCMMPSVTFEVTVIVQ